MALSPLLGKSVQSWVVRESSKLGIIQTPTPSSLKKVPSSHFPRGSWGAHPAPQSHTRQPKLTKPCGRWGLDAHRLQRRERPRGLMGPTSWVLGACDVLFGNVSRGREPSPSRTSPLKNNLHPAGQEAPARRHGALGSTPAVTRGASKGAVMVRCAGWALGCQVARPEGGSEGSGAPRATQTTTSPPSAPAGAAPDPPGKEEALPTHQAACGTVLPGQRKRKPRGPSRAQMR